MFSTRPSRHAPNLHKRSGKYYFRIRVPANIRHKFCTDEIKLSLHTDDPKAANRWAQVITGRVLVNRTAPHRTPSPVSHEDKPRPKTGGCSTTEGAPP